MRWFVGEVRVIAEWDQVGSDEAEDGWLNSDLGWPGYLRLDAGD